MKIELQRPFRKEQGKNRFRGTYRVTDVDSPGCVQVAVTLATRIQLEQEIKRQGVKYNDSVLEEISKVLVETYVNRGGPLVPDCAPAVYDEAIFIDYTDFDQLAAAAVEYAGAED
ncbi:MAG TPA: hypothetical protein VHJ78_04975 [Actinomycetota bacterium]|nr:hypothetical protein [Actinomycetota bacterium]